MPDTPQDRTLIAGTDLVDVFDPEEIDVVLASGELSTLAGTLVDSSYPGQAWADDSDDPQPATIVFANGTVSGTLEPEPKLPRPLDEATKQLLADYDAFLFTTSQHPAATFGYIQPYTDGTPNTAARLLRTPEMLDAWRLKAQISLIRSLERSGDLVRADVREKGAALTEAGKRPTVPLEDRPFQNVAPRLTSGLEPSYRRNRAEAFHAHLGTYGDFEISDLLQPQDQTTFAARASDFAFEATRLYGQLSLIGALQQTGLLADEPGTARRKSSPLPSQRAAAALEAMGLGDEPEQNDEYTL